MLSFPGSLKVFIALEPIDMRAGVNTLSALVTERLKEQAQSGALFVFMRWTPFFGQDCVKLSYGDHGWEW